MDGKKTYAFFYATALVVSLFGQIFAEGSLTVKTEPEGIEVWLDDKFVGDSPIFDKKLKEGRYELKLVDPVQHSSIVEEIFIQENETTIIEKTIKSKFGSLKVQSDPEGAKVFISTELGNTPVSNDFMNPGKYRVEIRSPNKKYHPVMEDIVIPRGETVSVNKTLQKDDFLNKKAKVRLVMGAVSLGGFIFALVEQKKARALYETVYANGTTINSRDVDISRALSVVGASVGSAALIGIEIVAFF